MNLYFAHFDVKVKDSVQSVGHALIAKSFEHLESRLQHKQNVVIDRSREQKLSDAWDNAKLNEL